MTTTTSTAPAPAGPDELTAAKVRIEILHLMVNRTLERIEQLETALAYAMGHLRWYADSEHYGVPVVTEELVRKTSAVFDDCGRRAQLALEQLELLDDAIPEESPDAHDRHD